MQALAVTGWGHKDNKERAAAAGFDAHLTKPADTESLQRTLAVFSEHGPRGSARDTEWMSGNSETEKSG
jgi:CheY-like chemotaxis protein